MAFKSKFEVDKYTRAPDTRFGGSNAPGQPNNQPGADRSRQRINDLLERRNKNAQTTASEYYTARNDARREQKQRQFDSDVGWGKLGMLGTAIGGMFGAPWLGMGLGSLAGLAKGTAARNKYGGNTVGNFFKTVTDVPKGLLNPIAENPLMAAGAAMSAAPYVMGDKTSLLGDLFASGPEMGQLGAAGGATPALSLDPMFDPATASAMPGQQMLSDPSLVGELGTPFFDPGIEGVMAPLSGTMVPELGTTLGQQSPLVDVSFQNPAYTPRGWESTGSLSDTTFEDIIASIYGRKG